MECYFDISNFKEFSKQTVVKETKESALACLRMLKKNFDIIINNYNDFDEDIEILLTEFQSGFEGNISYKDEVKKDILNNESNFFGSIILLDDHDLINSLKNKKQILAGLLKEETETLSKLFFDDYEMHKEEQIGRDITPDSFISLRDLPINKIFIIDRYLFKGPEIGGNISLFEHNIEKILKKLFENRRSKIDIIFVYQIHNKTISNTNKEYDNGPDKKKIVDRIKKLAHKHCPKPNICMIAVPKDRIKDEHDRHIITDYLRIKSGDTFTYFKSDGEIISKSLFIDLYSHGKKSYKDNSAILMSKINDYTNDCIEKYPDDIYIPTDYLSKDLIVF
ncbi:hypothetical protein ACQ7CX_10525 [Chryseobacterium arthrosphaerae]|uniref:hypothetical protein n=1 Tax=Chryseobacterium arthrosphaerae TaxID=651561 RepID=UPI001BAE59B9|nr:hypothetical protein [Chryseobacterium arthrosphaerae]QUY53876.1 hypothetical protein I2F65_13375 [Chryseobacterium arthrosphaerae]